VAAGATASGAAERDRGGRWAERRSWVREFDRAGVTGTALVFDEEARRFFVHDRKRAQDRFIPASTFKIMNALVALQNGNVSDEFEVLRWDGTKREIAAWNRDHSLASGMRFSVVWFYQEMARRTGQERMQDWVDRIGYGNRDLSGGIDQFWLTGGLRISAREQIALLRRLVDDELPFDRAHQDTVRRMMLQSAAPNFRLSGKTGWAIVPGQTDLGWYVGFSEYRDRRFFFALNIDMPSVGDAPKRELLARRLLADVGGLPADAASG
jgi:beta-lactamase class D